MLTYLQIDPAKPSEKAWALSNSPSLHLEIHPKGLELWRFRYRFIDTQKMLHLCGWPSLLAQSVDLDSVRPAADEPLAQVDRSIWPTVLAGVQAIALEPIV